MSCPGDSDERDVVLAIKGHQCGRERHPGVTAATVCIGWAGQGTASLTQAEGLGRLPGELSPSRVWKGKNPHHHPGDKGREAVGKEGKEHIFSPGPPQIYGSGELL